MTDRQTAIRAMMVCEGETSRKSPGTAGTPGTAQKSSGSNPLEFREFRAFRVQNVGLGKSVFSPGTRNRNAPPNDADADICEREGLALDSVPDVYLRAWATLQNYRPFGVSPDTWARVVDDAGRFLDQWGDDAEECGWSADDLFKHPRGLVWKIGGAIVEALSVDHARLADGRLLRR